MPLFSPAADAGIPSAPEKNTAAVLLARYILVTECPDAAWVC